MAASIPLKKEGEPNGNSTEEITSEETTSSEKDASEENHYEEDASTVNRIKERFFNKFRKPTTSGSESLVQQTAEISDSSREGSGVERTNTSGTTSSPGVTINSEDSTTPVDSQEVQKADWSINPPPIDHPEIELDSAGRVVTPVHPEFIVDWSNKDSTPKAIPKE